MSVARRLTRTLARGRAMAESLMIDTGTALRPTGEMVTDPATMREVPEMVAEFTSACKVTGGSRESDPQGRTVEIGGVERVVMVGGLQLPVSAPEVRTGWEWQVTAVDPSSDPQLLGKRYRIVEVPAKSLTVARRFDVVEV